MDRGERGGPRVVRARYGRAGEYTDVTEEVRRYAQRGEGFRVSPEAFKQCTVAWGTRSGTYGVSGVYANYPKMRRMIFSEGSAFSEADDFTHTRVAFIGADLKSLVPLAIILVVLLIRPSGLFGSAEVARA